MCVWAGEVKLVLCVCFKSFICSRAPTPTICGPSEWVDTANLRCSAEFAQYQRNAFKCPVTLSSLWALINTCKLAYLPSLSHGERGGITVKTKAVIGTIESSICGLHTNGLAICVAARKSQGEAEIRQGLQGGRICKVRTCSSGRERADQIPVMSWYEPETFLMSSPTLHIFPVAVKKEEFLLKK